MYKNFLIILALFNSAIIFSQEYSFLSVPDIGLPSIDYSTNNNFTNFNILIQSFQQNRYSLFLKELKTFRLQQPNYYQSNELNLLEGIALFQEKQFNQSRDILKNLTNINNKEISHQALLYLFQIAEDKGENGRPYLQIIQKAPLNTPYKEIAHIKLIYLLLQNKEFQLANILAQSFEKLYPQSLYLDELQYFIALNNLHYGHIAKARIYANNVLSRRTNIKIQRLLGELALQENKVEEALSYYLPISQTYNQYQDEGLYKSALLYKKQEKYQESHRLLSQLLDYHQRSPYIERAFTEFANINIALKNYDDALLYYLQESRKTGKDKAYALLKITEINFLKSNTTAIQRTVKRIQDEFPYSSFANEAIYWIGRSYLLEKNYPESIKNLEEYLTREPESTKKDEIRIFLGHAYANIDNQPKARSYFQSIINESRNEKLKRQALLGLGRSYSLNESKRALEYFDRVWKVWKNAPESEKALYYSAAIRYNLRLNKEALGLFKDFTDKFPESRFLPEANLAIAKLEFKSENFTEIINMNQIPLTANNREQVSELKELQARSLFRIENYEDALKSFQDSSLLTTNSLRKTDLFLAEASTLRSLGRHKEAVENYEQYLKSSDETTYTNELTELLWAEIAFSYLEIQNTTKAEETLEHIKTSYPNSKYITDIYFKIADEYFSKEQYKKSAYYYAETRYSTKDKNTQSEALLREAWSRSKFQDPQTTQIFELFLQQFPNHFGVPDIKLKLAKQLTKQKNTNNIALRHEIINKYPDSLEAEEVRNYFADQFNNKTSIEEYQLALSETKDKKLQAKYLYKLGKKFLNEENIEKALLTFQKIHNFKDPELGALALFEIGDILLQRKEYQKSLQTYVNIIAQYDEKFYPKSLDKIIQTYILLEDIENANKFKARLITQYPDSKESKKWN